MRELRLALRRLARAPYFAVASIAVIACGVGAALFAGVVIKALMHPDVGVVDAHRLLYVYQTFPGGQLGGLSYNRLRVFRDSTQAFQIVAGRSRDIARVGTGASATRLIGERVTGGYFETLGVSPLVGRAFSEQDDRPGAPPVIVISHALWRSQFHADPSAIGRVVPLAPALRGMTTEGGRAYTVIGVMPPEFRGTLSQWETTSYWVPLHQRAEDYKCDEPAAPEIWYLGVIGRLKAGATRQSAQAEADVLAASLAQASTTRTQRSAIVIRESGLGRLPFDPGGRMVPSRLSRAIVVVGLVVLFVAVVNAGGMLIVRAMTMRNEMSIRLALGATRIRALGEVAMEACLVALAGSVLGLSVARAMLTSFSQAVPERTGSWGSLANVSLDLTFDMGTLTLLLLVAGAAAAAVTGMAVWGGPRADAKSFRPAGPGSIQAGLGARVRQMIVVPQIAVSLVLVTVAGVLVSGAVRAELLNEGFESTNVVFASVQLPRPPRCEESSASGAMFEARQKLFAMRVQDEMSRHGGSNAVLSTALPTDRSRAWVTTPAKVALNEGEFVSASGISPGYFRLLGIPLREGRDFDVRDTSQPGEVAIVSHALAELLSPQRPVVGQSVGFFTPGSPRVPTWYEIVGVVGDVRSIDDGTVTPLLYLPLAQWGHPTTVMVQAQGARGPAIRALTSAVAAADPLSLVVASGGLDEVRAQMRFPRRAAAVAGGVSAAMSLLLASIGLYGVMGYVVVERRREFGIRSALGASNRDLVRLVLGQGARLGMMGLTAGIVLTFLAIRVASATVFAVGQPPFVLWVGAGAFVVGMMLVASYVPARRAAEVDPVAMLRHD